jgi:predicted phosphoadenosine phosphosulfate sulfurtransferase
VSRKKSYVDRACDELALDRLRLCYDRFDTVVVSFSGGKDSTACLNLAARVAAERGRLPLEVFTYDEEAIPPETVAYMARVAQRRDVRFHWYCLPIEARNACSRSSPHWYPWAAEDRHLWCRDLPAGAITEGPAGFRRQAPPEATPLIWGPRFGRVCLVMGIRTQESLTRYRSVTRKAGGTAFLSSDGDHAWIAKAYPIYDWELADVWLAPERFGWDYNRAYDVMQASGLSSHVARCSPPFGEQPIRRLHSYKTCWPELWAKMVDRVPGAATAARYANTDLYGIGVKSGSYAGNWRDRVMRALAALPADARKEVAHGIETCLRKHRALDPNPMPDDQPSPRSGFSWRSVYAIAASGGNKFSRQSQRVSFKAEQYRRKTGAAA